MANPLIRKRTIQHPGFEFFETDMSIYREYVQDTSALVVGFFSKGPILVPEKLTNLNDYTIYFGTPESEAEIYAYKGIESVLNSGGTVTALRLPYDNTTAEFDDTGAHSKYKAIIGNFQKSFTQPKNLVGAYENSDVVFQNIVLSSEVLRQDDITSIVGGTSDNDFAIINKYNDIVTEKGEEIFVTVLGIGNAIEEQGLDVETAEWPDPATIHTTAAFYEAYHITIASEEDGADFGVTFTAESLPEGAPKTFVNDEGLVVTNHVIAYDPAKDTLLVPGLIAKNPAKPTSGLYSKKYAIVSDGNESGTLFSRERLKWESSGNLADNGVMLTVGDDYPDTLPAWFPTIPTFTAEDENTYIDPRKDDIITVIVSKVKPSSLEAGKSNIIMLESFSGSIFKGSIDQISQESNYIGDIINENSNYISFYGKKSYEGYDKETNAIYVTDQVPLRLSWAEGSKPKAVVEINDSGEETVTVAELDPIGLEKRLWKNDSREFAGANYAKTIIRQALKKVQNNIMYLYRDAYDFGLSSVIAYSSASTGLYEPQNTNVTEIDQPGFLGATAWKKVVLEFARHCQYNHKLSMFHADSPRKLVLNGNLSRCDDLYQDQLDTVFTAKKIQAISIKDNTYMEQNCQWWEIVDEFNKTMMWAPNSIFQARNITWNDINGQVWDAPAGHEYGVVRDATRAAFNPESELMDRLYLNCINYGVTWPDGVMTIEGQKTAYSEISTLNRINARRLLIWLERYAQMVSANYIYQPNIPGIRDEFVSELETEFKRCHVFGGLYGFRIVCDDTNNPGEVIDRNELRVAIMVQVTKTIEFILANFIITKTGVNLEEVSPVF